MTPKVESKAIQAAIRILEKNHVKKAEDISVEDFAKAERLTVKEGALKGCAAWLVRDKQRGIIRVSNVRTSPASRRFSIAHELGHWILHEDSVGFDSFDATDDFKQQVSKAESEANEFASELLMPTHIFGPQCNSAPSFPLLKAIAKLFKTSLTATGLRFAEFSTHPHCFIKSKDGTIQWFRTQAGPEFQRVRQGFQLDKRSLASHLGINRDASPFQQVPVDAWIKGSNHKFTIEEQSLRLGDSDEILTILRTMK